MGCIICVLHVEHVERITVVLHGKHGECITPVLHGVHGEYVACVLHPEYAKCIILVYEKHLEYICVLHVECVLHLLHGECLWTSTKQLTVSSPMTRNIWKANSLN